MRTDEQDLRTAAAAEYQRENVRTTPPQWLADAVIYEIYPQSFADADGDGIGDLPGVRQRLDYLQWLGVNGIWFNPCFASPFRDAGYDVSDYLTVAPRYGTNDDLVAVAEGRGRAESGCCSTWSQATHPLITRGSAHSWATNPITATSGPTAPVMGSSPRPAAARVRT